MSNFCAIATVTATLSQMLNAPLDSDVPGAKVTIKRPDTDQEMRVNIYLYQVTPNASLRNVDLPTRRTEGELVQRPQVALNLHYLLTFYGDEAKLVPQRLLGSVVRTLHARPVLTRKMIRDAIASNEELAKSDLADQIELVKLTPVSLSTEELSKLWSVFFQTQYNLSIAYMATVVLIESEESTQVPLPVRESNIIAVPFHHIVVDKVISKAGASIPIVARSMLTIYGKKLIGNGTLVRIGGKELLPEIVNDTEINVQIPDGLQAGVHGVQVVHLMKDTPQESYLRVESNVAAFVLHPSIKNKNGNYEIEIKDIQADGNIIKKAKVIIKLDPEPGKRQRVILLLNDFQAESKPVKTYGFIAEPVNIFNWDKILKDDIKERSALINFLEMYYYIDWVKKAKIQKINDNTIKVLTEEGQPKSLSIELNREKTKINFKIDNRTDEFSVKLENGIPFIHILDTDETLFSINNIVQGEYLVRVQVDGAQSPLDVDARTKKYFSPKVKIPP